MKLLNPFKGLACCFNTLKLINFMIIIHRLKLAEQSLFLPPMLSRIKSIFHSKPDRYLNFVPLCHLPHEAPETWHRCPSMILSDESYDHLHEFLQANLEGRWSVLMQDRGHLDRYDVLLEVETEAGLIDLFRIMVGIGHQQAH